MTDLEVIKAQTDRVVDDYAEVLIDASHRIHANPELGFNERMAHDVLVSVLEDAGLAVTRGAYGMDTAFSASAGSSGPVIAVFSEYDALPEIGHACGHNVIGTAGIGAAIAAAAVAEELGGRVLSLGSPAEEGGGGKVIMAQHGALEGVDAALMVHPAGLDLSRFGAIAIQQVVATYHGRAAHAAAAPHLGRNALDAAILGYTNVAALRQHIRPDERVHGIISDGGTAPNVVPERAEAIWYVRSPTAKGLQRLKERFVACLEAGATAAGCRVELAWQDPAFANMVDNQTMIDSYRANAARQGRQVIDPTSAMSVVGSTDMGNISHVVPSIHPMIAVSPPAVAIHTQEFAGFAGASQGDQAVIDGAKIMAATIVDLWAQPEVLKAVKSEFSEQRASGLATGSPTI